MKSIIMIIVLFALYVFELIWIDKMINSDIPTNGTSNAPDGNFEAIEDRFYNLNLGEGRSQCDKRWQDMRDKEWQDKWDESWLLIKTPSKKL